MKVTITAFTSLCSTSPSLTGEMKIRSKRRLRFDCTGRQKTESKIGESRCQPPRAYRDLRSRLVNRGRIFSSAAGSSVSSNLTPSAPNSAPSETRPRLRIGFGARILVSAMKPAQVVGRLAAQVEAFSSREQRRVQVVPGSHFGQSVGHSDSFVIADSPRR